MTGVVRVRSLPTLRVVPVTSSSARWAMSVLEWPSISSMVPESTMRPCRPQYAKRSAETSNVTSGLFAGVQVDSGETEKHDHRPGHLGHRIAVVELDDVRAPARSRIRDRGGDRDSAVGVERSCAKGEVEISKLVYESPCPKG